MRPFLFILCLFTSGALLLALRGQAQPTPGAIPRLAQVRRELAALPDTSQVDKLRDLCGVYVEAGRFAEAQATVRWADSLARRNGNPNLLSGVYLTAGYLAGSLGDFPQSLAAYQRALELARRTGNYRRQVNLLNRLGATADKADNPAAARRYLRQALVLAQARQLPALEASSYADLANLVDRQGQHTLAVAYGAKALALLRQLHDEPQYYLSLVNQGIHLKNLGRLTEAEAAYRQALAYAQQQHDEFLIGYIRVNLPSVLLGLGRTTEAEHIAQLALAWQRQVRQPDGFREVYDLLSRIKEKQGELGPALAYGRLAAAYADTLHNAAQQKQLLLVETRYQTREKQARITQLAQANAQQTRQLWALGLGLLLVSGLLTGNIAQYAALRRRNGQLQASNDQVQQQASRLRLLLKELHHRVKNNLAIISSLLYMQAHRLQDAGAARAVREGQQRVAAMSLIHQRLYQTDVLTAIDLPSYVAELAEGLLTAYGFDPATFDLVLDVTQPVLDVEVAIPIGLILNELLTNAFKHAYQDVARPRLAVRLGAGAGGTLELEVCDNGPGFVLPSQATTSFGQQLIQVLSEQLGANLTFSTQAGTCCLLRLPEMPFPTEQAI